MALSNALENLEFVLGLLAHEMHLAAQVQYGTDHPEAAGAYEASAALLEESVSRGRIRYSESILGPVTTYFLRSGMEQALEASLLGQNKKRLLGAFVAFKSAKERKRRGKNAIQLRVPHR